MLQGFVNRRFEVVQGMDTTDSNFKIRLAAGLCDLVEDRSIIGFGRMEKVTIDIRLDLRPFHQEIEAVQLKLLRAEPAINQELTRRWTAI